MFTGNAAELRRMENRAAELAEEVAHLLNEIGRVGVGPATGRIDGPGFSLVNYGTRWEVRS